MSSSSTSSSDPRTVRPDDGVRVPPGETAGLGVTRSPRRRRALALSVVAALVVVVGAEVALRALPALPPPLVWNDVEVDDKVERLAVIGSDDLDTVYVGSSIIDAAIDPEVVGEHHDGAGRGFNAALEGADGRSIAAWVTEVVAPLADPDLVVIGISPRELNDNGQNQREFASTFFASRGWRQASGQETAADRLNRFAEDHSSVVRSRSRLRDPASTLRFWANGSRSAWQPPNDPDTGRLLRFDTVVDYMAPDPEARHDVFNDYRADGRAARALDDAVRELQDRGIAVVLLQPAVVSEDLEAVLSPRDIVSAHAVVERIAATNCAPLVDLSQLLSERRFFADNVHVNAAGRDEVSRALGERLTELEEQGDLRIGCDQAN